MGELYVIFVFCMLYISNFCKKRMYFIIRKEYNSFYPLKGKIFLNQDIPLVGFPGGSVVKNPLANAGDVGEETATDSSILSGKPHGQRRLVDCIVCGVEKSRA